MRDKDRMYVDAEKLGLSQPPSLENPFEGVSVNATLTLDGMVTTSKLGESL